MSYDCSWFWDVPAIFIHARCSFLLNMPCKLRICP
nr:MAG TPA: hypothetical protein [Caudoviricetes sp.]